MNDELQRKIDSIPEIEEKEIANIPEWNANVEQVYVRTKTVRKVGGKLFGKFAASLSKACDERNESSIQISAILLHQYVGVCDDAGPVDSYVLQ